WVSARHAVPAEIRLYDRLFTVPDPDVDEGGKSYRDYLNLESRRVVTGYVEPAAATAEPEQSFQFERNGYFVADRRDHRSDAPVFHRSASLRDSWARQACPPWACCRCNCTSRCRPGCTNSACRAATSPAPRPRARWRSSWRAATSRRAA